MRLTIRDASSPRVSLIALDLKSDISVLANAAMEFLRYVSPIAKRLFAFLVQDIGREVYASMKKPIKYTHEPLVRLSVVEDFLPPPSELVFREDTEKVTIALS